MRRAQAALEYLITYGWGFLVIILLIGVLAYFGLLSPSMYVAQRCEFGAQLECIDWQLKSDGVIYLQFRNNFGDDILIRAIHTPGESRSIGADFTTSTGTFVIAKGNVSEVFNITPLYNNNLGLAEGDRVTVPMVITFRRNMPGSPDHNVSGEVFATVQ